MKKLLSLFTALLLCTAMWGATTNQTLYKVEGALYQGLDENFTGGKNIFVPNDSAAVFTSFDGLPADWYRSNSLQEGGKGTPSFTFQKGFGDYAPIQIKNYTGYKQNATETEIDYIYGKASATGTSLSVGASTMNMMSMANGYYFRTEDTGTPGNIGLCYVDNKTTTTADSYKENYGTYMQYGTDFTHATYGAVKAYDMIVDNPGEMYIDYIVLPIFGYPKTTDTDIKKMIPEEEELTITLYPIDLTLSDKGVYSYTRKTPAITTVTATADNFTTDGSNTYRGAVKFTLEEPLLISGDFVARLTWTDDCKFGLVTDKYNLQNYTTWYLCADDKVHYIWTGGGYNSSISYHATFPTLDKKDTKTALNFASTGGSDNVAFMSNIDPAKTEDFTIDFGGAEWISMTDITYSGGTYKKSGTNTLKFEAKPNTTGKTRKATITLKHHGKELKYTVSQESMLSAFYEVPANAFFAGMTETGDTAAVCKTFYLPYNYGQEYTFTSTEAGDWTSSEEGTPDETQTNCSYPNRTMKDSCHTPLLAVDGKVGYQYGASGESFDENLYFHIGDSVMHYMTPARLYGEYGKLTNYLRSEYNVGTHSTIGVYFDNKDVMYIDGISIPVKNSASGATEASLFPTGSKITVNIYEAPGIVARSTDNKSKRSSTCKKTIELKSNNYQKYSDDQTQRGALSTTFDPIVITGPFVVELINDGCVFTVYSSTEKENKWGYYIDNNEEVYPATYTPLISVHAMFPVLYPKAGEGESLTIDNIPAKGVSKELGGRPIRNIYANCKYEAEKNGWSRIKPDFITFNFSNSKDYATWYFTIMPNTTGAVREGDVTFKFRGKELTYHVTQKAPTLTPREGMDNKQKFEIPLQDDTVHINGNKVTKVYLESEVSLKDTIKVTSEKELTKIVKWFGSENGKYYVYFIFTRAKYVKEDTEDKITISFKDNPDNKYEYTILHKGAGKLTTNHNYRTIVFGPKANRKGLFLNDKGELQKDYFINIKAKIPANKILYIANKNRFYDTGFAYGEQGTANEYLQLCPKTKSNTETVLEEDLRILIPNVDTITFHLIQEAKARVWQHNADRDTALEVNDKGDVAHFKGRLTTKMTIVSNTPVTEDDIDIKFSNNEEKWVTPSTEIKQTATRDSVFITFNVAKLEGTEPRSTDITVSILDNEFTVPLTQKTFAIEWSNSGYDEELVVPVAGGIANWKGSYNPYLNVFGTEAYRDALLKVTAPEGVEIIRQTDTLFTGRQRTVFTFSKKDTLTADWSGEITVSFDSTNTDEGFDYHFSKTFTITQAAARVWLAEDQQPLVIAAEGGESNEFTIWSNMNIQSKDWTVTKKPTWVDGVTNVSAGPDGANYYRKLKANAAANTGTEKREGKITIKHKTLTNLSIEINISQDPLPAPEPDFTLENKTAGAYATICLPGKIDHVENATLFHISHGNINKVEFEEVKDFRDEPAGMPYLVQVTEDGIVKFFCDKTVPQVETPVTPEDANGFVGSLQEAKQDVPDNGMSLLVSGGQLHLAAENCYLTKNHAYIDVYNVPESPNKAPNMAARRVTLYNPNAVPTNLNGLNGTVKPMKVLRDGQLYIIRDTRTYNAQGIEVQ